MNTDLRRNLWFMVGVLNNVCAETAVRLPHEKKKHISVCDRKFARKKVLYYYCCVIALSTAILLLLYLLTILTAVSSYWTRDTTSRWYNPAAAVTSCPLTHLYRLAGLGVSCVDPTSRDTGQDNTVLIDRSCR